jgi:hypothetical protein
MSEMDSRGTEIDGMLRRSLGGPVPRLSPEFERRLSRELRRRSEPSSRYERILLVGYCAFSVATSVLVMRGHGLGWGLTATMTLGPLAMVEAARRMRRLRGV